MVDAGKTFQPYHLVTFGQIGHAQLEDTLQISWSYSMNSSLHHLGSCMRESSDWLPSTLPKADKKIPTPWNLCSLISSFGTQIDNTFLHLKCLGWFQIPQTYKKCFFTIYHLDSISVHTIFSPIVDEHRQPTCGTTCGFAWPTTPSWMFYTRQIPASFLLYVHHTQQQVHGEFLFDFTLLHVKILLQFTLLCLFTVLYALTQY